VINTYLNKEEGKYDDLDSNNGFHIKYFHRQFGHTLLINLQTHNKVDCIVKPSLL